MLPSRQHMRGLRPGSLAGRASVRLGEMLRNHREALGWGSGAASQ